MSITTKTKYEQENHFFLEMGAGLEFAIILSQPPECWDYRLMPTLRAPILLKVNFYFY
jgi:hypothetical protein